MAQGQGLNIIWQDRHPPVQSQPFDDSMVAVAWYYDPFIGEPIIYAAGPVSRPNGATVYGILRYSWNGQSVTVAEWPSSDTQLQFIPTALAVRVFTPPYDEKDPWVFITGHVPGLNGTRDCVTVAFTATLQYCWEKAFNHQGSDPAGFAGDDIPVAIAVDTTMVAVALTSRGQSTGDDIQLLTYTVDGFELGTFSTMRRTSAGAFHDSAVGVSIADNGDVFLAGNYTHSNGFQSVRGWHYVVGGPGFVDELATPSGGYQFEAKAMKQLGATMYLTGRYRLNDQASDDIMVAKFHFPAHSSSWVIHHDGGGGNGGGLAIDAMASPNLPPAGGTFIAVGGFRSENVSSNQELTLLYRDGAPLPVLWWASNPDDHYGGLDNRVVSVAVTEDHTVAEDKWRVYSTAVYKPASGVGYGWRTRRYYSGEEPTAEPQAPFAHHIFTGPINQDRPAALAYITYSPNPPQVGHCAIITGWSTGLDSAKDAYTIRYKDVAP